MPAPTMNTARPSNASSSQPISAENRRPATTARGNARPLEAPPSAPRPQAPQQPQQQAAPPQQSAQQWGDATDNPDDNATRVEVNPLLRPPPPQPPKAPDPPPQQTKPERQPTVTVGNSAIGVRSKKVVPLDDTRKR